MKNEFNDGKNLVFLPFWGGEVTTEVAKHVHAILEKPSQLTEDFYKKTQDKMNALAQRAFKSYAKTALFIQEIPKKNYGSAHLGIVGSPWLKAELGKTQTAWFVETVSC